MLQADGPFLPSPVSRTRLILPNGSGRYHLAKQSHRGRIRQPTIGIEMITQADPPDVCTASASHRGTLTLIKYVAGAKGSPRTTAGRAEGRNAAKGFQSMSSGRTARKAGCPGWWS